MHGTKISTGQLVPMYTAPSLAFWGDLFHDWVNIQLQPQSAQTLSVVYPKVPFLAHCFLFSILLTFARWSQESSLKYHCTLMTHSAVHLFHSYKFCSISWNKSTLYPNLVIFTSETSVEFVILCFFYTTQALANSLVSSKLDYCNSVYCWKQNCLTEFRSQLPCAFVAVCLKGVDAIPV